MNGIKSSCKAILLAGFGLSAVATAQAQEMYLGFTDTAATASAHNDYVIDLGAASSFTTSASLSGSVTASTISTAYSSVDANYLNDVSVGAAAGQTSPSKYFDMTVGFVSGLSASQFSSGIGNAVSSLSGVQVGEYASSSVFGWSYNVAQDPNNIGADINGSVASNLGNNMQYLVSGVVTQTLYSAVVGGTTRNPVITTSTLGTLKVDLVHDQWTFTGANLTPPVAAFSGTPTTGSAPLKVAFTDASTGNITNWLWNFGDGHSVTNTTSVSVTNTYASAGSYTVSLTVTGPNGNNALSKTNYIVVSSGTPPAFASVNFSSGNLVISGTNGTSGTQYRILMATNISSGTWVPVFTNQFLGNGSFSYTNHPATSGAGFFRLVTP